MFFFYNGCLIKVVESFKYLGLIFHESGDKKWMILQRLKQARRALAVWRRRCSVWLMDGLVCERLFKTIVLPALEYGLGIWGACMYNSAVWKEVEDFWRYAAKTIVGVPVRTPSAAVFGDLGWYEFATRA